MEKLETLAKICNSKLPQTPLKGKNGKCLNPAQCRYQIFYSQKEAYCAKTPNQERMLTAYTTIL